MHKLAPAQVLCLPVLDHLREHLTYRAVGRRGRPELVGQYRAACRDAKRQVSGNRKYRGLKEKSLKMIRFIAGYDKPPNGRQLLEAWNATEWVEKDSTWYYDPDKRGSSSRFWRDYHRARRALVYEKRTRCDDI
jgi:hypothetical protein